MCEPNLERMRIEQKKWNVVDRDTHDYLLEFFEYFRYLIGYIGTPMRFAKEIKDSTKK